MNIKRIIYHVPMLLLLPCILTMHFLLFLFHNLALFQLGDVLMLLIFI